MPAVLSMLDLFRKKGLSSVVYGAIVVAMALALVIGFRPNAGGKIGSLKELCVAQVHNFCIDPKSHMAAYSLLVPRDESGAANSAQARKMGLSEIVRDGLIERELLIDEAHRLGITVTEDEVTDEILLNSVAHVSLPTEDPALAYSLRVPDGKIRMPFKDPKSKQFDMKTYERALRNFTGRSPTEFRAWQERELLASKVRDVVRAPVRVAEEEAWLRYSGEKSNATLSYVPIRHAYIEKHLSASDAEVDAWAKANPSLVGAPMIRHILAKFPAGDAGADGRNAAKAKIEKALARVKKGESFADIAKEISEDGSASQGGQLGEKTEGFVEPFRKAADALKAGEMTQEPVETQFGYHIIKKDDPRRASFLKAKAHDEAKAIAAKILADVKAGKSAEEAAKAAASKYAKAAPAPEKKADGDAGAPPPAKTEDSEAPQLLTSSSFNRTGDPLPGVSGEAARAVLNFAFTAKAGAAMPEPVEADGDFYVVLVKEQKVATKEEFAKDRDTFVQTLLSAKQAETLGNYVRGLRETKKGDIKKFDENLFDSRARRDAGPVEEELEP